MTAKEYLSQLQEADEYIRQAYAELTERRAVAEMTSAYDYSGVKVKTSGGDKLASAAASLIDLEQELAGLINDYINLKRVITGQIRGMKNLTYSALLYRRYAEYKSLGQIAKEMDYSYERIKHLHGKALQEFGNTYEI